jgi:hypothetical protein
MKDSEMWKTCSKSGNAYKILVRNLPLQVPTCSWENTLKIGFKRIGCESVIHVAEQLAASWG